MILYIILGSVMFVSFIIVLVVSVILGKRKENVVLVEKSRLQGDPNANWGTRRLTHVSSGGDLHSSRHENTQVIMQTGRSQSFEFDYAKNFESIAPLSERGRVRQ